MPSLRQFATDFSSTFGNAEHPPALHGKDAMKLARMAKAVDLLVEHPAPTVGFLAEGLGISRATVYRLIADSAFQVMLRKALDGRISLVARKAMDKVEKALDEGSPALQFKAATWLLERQCKLLELAGVKDAELRDAENIAQAREELAALKRARLKARAVGPEQELLEESPDDDSATDL